MFSRTEHIELQIGGDVRHVARAQDDDRIGAAGGPAGWGSTAAESSRFAVVPADHGPAAIARMPRAGAVFPNNRAAS